MRIVTSKNKSGNHSSLTIPCASIVKQSPQSEIDAVASVVCDILNIKADA